MSDNSSQTAPAQLPLKRQRGHSLNIGAFERGKKVSSRRTFKDTLKLWEIKYCSNPRDEEVRILPSLIHVIREANLCQISHSGGVLYMTKSLPLHRTCVIEPSLLDQTAILA